VLAGSAYLQLLEPGQETIHVLRRRRRPGSNFAAKLLHEPTFQALHAMVFIEQAGPVSRRQRRRQPHLVPPRQCLLKFVVEELRGAASLRTSQLGRHLVSCNFLFRKTVRPADSFP
jgi:hypothetical protein